MHHYAGPSVVVTIRYTGQMARRSIKSSLALRLMNLDGKLWLQTQFNEKLRRENRLVPPSMTGGKLTLSRMAAGTTISTRMFLMPTGFSVGPLDTDPLPVGPADAGGDVGVGLFITNLCDTRTKYM